jgi:tRNA A37 N6-isopentenylltransferase MiaA
VAIDTDKIKQMKEVAKKSQLKVKEKKERKPKSDYPTVGIYISKDNVEYLEELSKKYPQIPRSRFFREFINCFKEKYGLDIPLDRFIGK